MINWFIQNPLISGIITTLLMWGDYFLTLVQQKEMHLHYNEHYKSYPVNTIEGNKLLRQDVERLRIVNVKHLLLSIFFGTLTWWYLSAASLQKSIITLGVIWGLFLIVITQHISNILAYRSSRNGIHGKILMHQRTGYLIQAGRYLAIFIFTLVLSILVDNPFLYGVTIAALISSIRMLIWMRGIPKIDKKDLPPEG